MFRSLLAGLLAAGVVFAAGLPGTTAQDKKDDKKDPPKKKERIAIAEPKDAAKDPDFAIQGEYTGEVTKGSKTEKVGAQVIAKGSGQFDVKFLGGGLPGEGWDGRDKYLMTAAVAGEKVTVMGADKEQVGTITGGKLVVTTKPGVEVTLTRVERKSKTLGEKPPQGAVVLWAAPGDEKNWNNGRLLELSDGKFLTVAKIPLDGGKKLEGDMRSKEKFGAFKAHVEFRLPWMPNSREQGRGNSGVYLQDRYECQVLDSFGLSGENNECGGIYQQYKPLVNMCLPPLVWQTYDFEFTPAEFDADGKKTKPARATIFHNGVKIHDNIELKGPTGGGKPETKDPGPLQLQDHGDPVVYRNVWVVPVK
jgi:hypothetical protein